MSEIEKQYEGMSLVPCDEDFIEFKNTENERASNPIKLSSTKYFLSEDLL